MKDLFQLVLVLVFLDLSFIIGEVTEYVSINIVVASSLFFHHLHKLIHLHLFVCVLIKAPVFPLTTETSSRKIFEFLIFTHFILFFNDQV